MSEPRSFLWRDIREKGSLWGMLFTAAVYRWFGRGVTEPVLWGVVAYFFLKDGRMRRASLQYLQKIGSARQETRQPGWMDVYRHCLSFARTSLDRFDVWTDRLDRYTFQRYGEELLLHQVAQGRGAVLLGAHLGNFDMLRALARRRGGKVHIVTDRQNSQKFSESLRRFAPHVDQGVVEYDAGSMNVIFDLKQAVERGEFVGLLGDRIAATGGRGARRMSPAMFLGEQALFPQSSFLFAALLECPVFLVISLRRSHQDYDIYVERFAERIELPEGPREEALARYAALFAARLEHYCRLAPLQWFNFYDFWGKPS
jgi:predicted LPLAT superfamily acyltransferase